MSKMYPWFSAIQFYAILIISVCILTYSIASVLIYEFSDKDGVATIVKVTRKKIYFNAEINTQRYDLSQISLDFEGDYAKGDRVRVRYFSGWEGWTKIDDNLLFYINILPLMLFSCFMLLMTMRVLVKERFFMR